MRAHRSVGPRLLTAAVGATLAMSLVVAGPAYPAPAVDQSPITTDSITAPGEGVGLDLAADCVASATLKSVAALTQMGSEQEAHDGDGLGRIYRYDLNGNLIEQRTAPIGWVATEASDIALSAFGFPPRPQDPLSLLSWASKVAAMRTPGPTGMCTTSKVNNVIRTDSSSNWAGGKLVQPINKYDVVYLAWKQTGFDYCPGVALKASSYATWAGIGGANSPRLMQAGTDTSHGSVNGIYAWWEMLNYLSPNPEVAFTGSVIHPGDEVDTTTTYLPDRDQVSFNVTDRTTGVYYNAGPLELYQGQPTSRYYDGSTAEFITEAPSGGPAPGGLYYLRKPHLLTTLMEFQFADYADPALRDSVRVREVGPSGNLMQTTTWDGGGQDHNWETKWVSCS